jgi:acyl-coenzyme A synthetase/AMP-(fatty) acid ligase
MEPKLSTQPRLHSEAARKAFHDAGLWGDKLIVDYIDEHARRTPGKAAIIDGRETITYATLARRSENLAAALKTMGVGAGEVVAVRAPNWAELPLAHLAANRIGAIFLPLAEGFAEVEMRHLLRRSRARILLAASGRGACDVRAFLAAHHSDLPALKQTVVLRGAPVGDELSFDTLADDDGWRGACGPEHLAGSRPDPDGPSHVMVSSGTTGLPRCSLFSDNNTLVKLLLQYCGSVAQVTSTDVAAALAPAGTGSTGYNYPILAPLLVGATSVMLEHWSGSRPEQALRLIERHACTYAAVVPAQLAKLVAVPNLHDYDLHHLRFITNSGAKLPPPIAEAAETAFRCKVQSIYGCSEAGAVTMTAMTDPEEKRLHTAGRTVPRQEFVISDDNGNPAGADRVGEVCWLRRRQELRRIQN